MSKQVRPIQFCRAKHANAFHQLGKYVNIPGNPNDKHLVLPERAPQCVNMRQSNEVAGISGISSALFTCKLLTKDLGTFKLLISRLNH